ncbi:hypothetical protein [Pedobacter sp. MR2016-24]|uniref:hypothetical protein n=1 Tax=Pedobacter sp. MR2016-24 TaxID=2994466 RepID=UPI0022450A05|nr:hypothetical protein [Pedobacter sp. MR2016-24]MCX2485796.1 hypothetical protein [Pedobacter sp. MR2016-24]
MRFTDYPADKPVVTTTFVTEKYSPLISIVIDNEGDIEALSNDEAEMEEAVIITLAQLATIDPSVKTIAEMNSGSSFIKNPDTSIWVKS